MVLVFMEIHPLVVTPTRFPRYSPNLEGSLYNFKVYLVYSHGLMVCLEKGTADWLVYKLNSGEGLNKKERSAGMIPC